ncbi:hypothetical protein GCM10009801_48050 [Streptomyces albiaxialis]|uniref:Uncharacterized protein n=1 Tax=Streptomyces albiaxialis TaxID=329523 RepID=A0ABN2WA18_9ACTN
MHMDMSPQGEQPPSAVHRQENEQSKTAQPSASEEGMKNPAYFGPPVCMPSITRTDPAT